MPKKNEKITPIGRVDYRNRSDVFGIQESDRRRHTYIVGKTGMGKTTLLENMVISDILAGKGLAIVDPHGEFADKILDYVPKERIDDVIYFNPGDLDYPMAFNAIESVPKEYRHIIADGLVGVFKKIWADSWGPRLEYVLRNALTALLEYQGSTLLSVMRLLTNKDYRKKVVENITDPVVKDFWVEEYAKYPDRFQSEAIAPIQNKVGQFLTSSLIRNVVGQERSAFQMRKIMDEEKILILNLAKGKIGEGSSALLGAMMITKMQLAAMSRVDIAREEERKDFYLYVDEFQNFATDSFADILSEARKYRLNLILAHQYVSQLAERVSDSVFGNVGTLVTFRVGAADAEFLEREFAPAFNASDLVNLPQYKIYLRLMIDGVAHQPFSASTLPPYPKPEKSYKEDIIAASRKNYATPREEIEKQISSWSKIATEEKQREEEAAGSRPVSVSPEGKPLYEAECTDCQKKTLVPFIPEPGKPVYCKKCRKKHRVGQHQSTPASLSTPGESERSNSRAARMRPDPPSGGRQRKEVDVEDLKATLRETLRTDGNED